MEPVTGDEEAALALLRRQYLALIPLRLWNWPAPLPSVESVLATVVDHPLALANQPPAKHALRFLKVWLGKLERVGTVDCSELYERIAVLVVGNTDVEGWCYKSYWLSANAAITLHESTKMVSAATTGLCTWNGALTLAEWVLEHRSVFAGKCVVELGSGIGLAGILLAQSCSATRVVLTDHSQDVLKTLRGNIELNKVAALAEARYLDWTEGAAAVAPDVLIASDVVFDPELCTALAAVINGILTEALKPCELYIASTVRNPATLVQFVAELRGHGLVVTPNVLGDAYFPRTDAFPVEFHHVVAPSTALAAGVGSGAGSGAGQSAASTAGGNANSAGAGAGASYGIEVGRYGAEADSVDA
eukprot:gene16932-16786_t